MKSLKILFNVIPEKGHIHPLIGPAQHLQQRGHEVAFTAACDIRQTLAKAGLTTFLGDRQKPPPLDANRGAELAELVRDPQVLRGWIRELIVDRVPAQVEPLRAIVRRWKPDVIVTDPMVYASAIVAESEDLETHSRAGVKIPWAAVSNSLNPVLPDDMRSELLDTVAELAPPRRELLQRYSLELDFRGCDILSPHLTIAFATREFIGRSVPGVNLVGPSMPLDRRGDECDFPWHKLRPDQPLVLMSLGSQIFHQPHMFRTVAEALDGRGVQLVLSMSELLDSAEMRPVVEADHVLAVRYAPQLQLLERASVLVTHGGANSVMEALHFAVPILISPICNDQFHQARLVDQRGVGLVLDLACASPEQCWTAVQSLLAPEPIRRQMKRMSQSYQADGAGEAARLIEELAQRPSGT